MSTRRTSTRKRKVPETTVKEREAKVSKKAPATASVTSEAALPIASTSRVQLEVEEIITSPDIPDIHDIPDSVSYTHLTLPTIYSV